VLGLRYGREMSPLPIKVGQMKEQFQVKDPLVLKYYASVTGLIEAFSHVKIEHTFKQNNSWADMLSNLVVGKGKRKT